ncbi:DUF6924 domain-containing protein [Gordonia sp. (in: high G+C Gram-positive bacteria)]|uniref:DUF6924 domain-containing protein n=1 Tax=Gordonia sp. (in: high G+C Gram-positive bacteria) TaxID=84139 RepID=UPI003F99D1EA
MIIRTDFSTSEDKWREILLATSEPIFLDGAEGPLSIDATFINDTTFDGASPLDVATAESENLPAVAVLADAVTFSRKKPVTFAAVDMSPESPGRTFRFRVQELWLVVTNLVQGNLFFDELYDSAIDGVLPEDPNSPQYKGL